MMRALVAALIVLFAASLLGCPGRIVEYPDKQELSKEQLKAALTGTDFRQKNAAREQMGKLTPAEQLELLQELLADGDAPTRMLAISELLKFPPETYQPLLADVAANDPDEEVRELAAMAIEEEEPEEPEAEEAPAEAVEPEAEPVAEEPAE
jgi:HEAT repeat protein